MENEKLENKLVKVYSGKEPNTTVAVYGSLKETGTMEFSDDPDLIQNEAYSEGYDASLVAGNAQAKGDYASPLYCITREQAYLQQVGIKRWLANCTYQQGSIVAFDDPDNEQPRLYYSMTDNNIGNSPYEDEENWKEFKFGGGGGIPRERGELVPSITPISNYNYKLCDGSLIDGSEGTMYRRFYNWLIAQKATTSSLFITQEEYDTQITNQGVCGKFVLDTEAENFRLPTIKGFIEATLLPNQSGDYTEAGLPNITGTDGKTVYNPTGFIYKIEGTSGYNSNSTTNPGTTGYDASRLNKIYGNSDTVQPASIKILYYIFMGNIVNMDDDGDNWPIPTPSGGNSYQIGDIIETLRHNLKDKSFKRYDTEWGMYYTLVEDEDPVRASNYPELKQLLTENIGEELFTADFNNHMDILWVPYSQNQVGTWMVNLSGVKGYSEDGYYTIDSTHRINHIKAFDRYYNSVEIEDNQVVQQKKYDIAFRLNSNSKSGVLMTFPNYKTLKHLDITFSVSGGKFSIPEFNIKDIEYQNGDEYTMNILFYPKNSSNSNSPYNVSITLKKFENNQLTRISTPSVTTDFDRTLIVEGGFILGWNSTIGVQTQPSCTLDINMNYIGVMLEYEYATLSGCTGYIKCSKKLWEETGIIGGNNIYQPNLYLTNLIWEQYNRKRLGMFMTNQEVQDITEDGSEDIIYIPYEINQESFFRSGTASQLGALASGYQRNIVRYIYLGEYKE